MNILTTYEVTTRSPYRTIKPTVDTIQAYSEEEARKKFPNKQIIAIAPIKKMLLGKVSLVKGVIA